MNYLIADSLIRPPSQVLVIYYVLSILLDPFNNSIHLDNTHQPVAFANIPLLDDVMQEGR